MDRQIKILALIIIMPYTLWAQKETTSSTQELLHSKIGVSFSTLGDWDFVSKNNEILIGGSLIDISEDNFYSIGALYIHPITKQLDLEFELEYSNFTYYEKTESGGCAISILTNKYDISLLEIPIQVRFNFLKYLFINGGLVIDIDTSRENTVDNQGGLGYILGVGAKYEFKSKWGVFVNPYLKNRALISVSTNNDHRKHIMESSFKFGITYNLK